MHHIDLYRAGPEEILVVGDGRLASCRDRGHGHGRDHDHDPLNETESESPKIAGGDVENFDVQASGTSSENKSDGDAIQYMVN